MPALSLCQGSTFRFVGQFDKLAGTRLVFVRVGGLAVYKLKNDSFILILMLDALSSPTHVVAFVVPVWSGFRYACSCDVGAIKVPGEDLDALHCALYAGRRGHSARLCCAQGGYVPQDAR